MSRARKRGLQRWSVKRWLANVHRKEQAAYGKPKPPLKLVRFDDVMRQLYPLGIERS